MAAAISGDWTRCEAAASLCRDPDNCNPTTALPSTDNPTPCKQRHIAHRRANRGSGDRSKPRLHQSPVDEGDDRGVGVVSGKIIGRSHGKQTVLIVLVGIGALDIALGAELLKKAGSRARYRTYPLLKGNLLPTVGVIL